MLISIFLVIITVFLFPPSVSAANQCNEIYYLNPANRTQVISTNINNPGQGKVVSTFTPPFSDQPMQPYLFSLNNSLGVIYKKPPNHDIYFQNLSTGESSVIQPFQGGFSHFWPRAVQLSNGTILVAISRLNNQDWNDCKYTPNCLFDARIRIYKSTDGGKTWERISELINADTKDPARGGLWQPHLVELNNHTIGLLVNEQVLRDQSWNCVGPNVRSDTTSFYLSNDQGQSWNRKSNVYTINCGHNNEGSFIQLADGRLVAVFSAKAGPFGTISLSTSSNLGSSWSTPIVIAATGDKANAVYPLLHSLGSKYALTYNKVPSEDERIFSLKIGSGLTTQGWNSPDYTPTISGNTTLNPTCFPAITPTTKPGDFNSDGHVNLADYNKLVSGYGTTYNLSHYNQLVANYGR